MKVSAVNFSNTLFSQSEKCTTTDGLVEEMFKSLFGNADTDETKQKVSVGSY